MTAVRDTAPAVWQARCDEELSGHTVGSLLRARAAEDPDAPAFVHVPQDGGPALRWSVAELLDAAARVAAGLRARVAPGERVAIWAPNVAQWPVFEYAAALAGVTLVAVNPAARPDELEHALRVSRSAVLVHAEAVRDRDTAAVVRRVVPRLPDLRHVVPLGRWDELVAGGPLKESDVDDPGAPAQIQFTSGSTGLPKAVLLTHRAVVNVARFTMEALGVRPGSVVVSPLPMFHTAGCVVSCLGPLWASSAFVLMERFEPRELLDTLRAEHADVLTSVPTVLTATLRASAPGERLPVLDAVLTGAAPVRAELIRDVERAFGATVFNLYGQTEMAPVVSLTRPEDPPETKAETVGRPMPHLECRVLDPATGDVCARDEVGELTVRGYQQMLGYEGDPAATAAAVDADGWLHTGDLVSMDATGALRIVGRLKELIIRGGENIAPGGIEAVLARIDGVRDVAVVGVPDELWGEVVGAVVVPDPDRPPDVAAWARRCRDELAGAAVPQVWFVADELPATASGKLARGEVRARIASGALVPVAVPEEHR